MEDRKKMIENAELQAQQMTEIADNFLNFAKTLTKDLPEEDKKKLDEALNEVKIDDLSPTIAKVSKEIERYRKKYSR